RSGSCYLCATFKNIRKCPDMRNTLVAKSLGTTLLAAAVAGAISTSAHAQTPATATEIQQLQQQLRELEARLETLTVAAPAANATQVTNNGRSITTRSADGDFSFQFGGRLQLDAAAYNGDNNDYGDGTKVRRLFLDARGTFAKDWNYR